MTAMKTWKCEVCGYIHQGDEPPGNCPVCGVEKEMFSFFEIAPAVESIAPVTVWRCTICDYRHEGESPPETCPVCGAGKSLFEAIREAGPEVFSGEGISKIVVLGAGIAGVTAAEQARRTSQVPAITIISKESSLPYYRLNLARYLAGEVLENDIIIYDQTWFDRHKITHLHGDAVEIDRDLQEVVLRDGRRINYDHLVMANGSHPFVPPIPGVAKEGVLSLRTLENANAILDQLKPGDPCVCIGGGLLGLETAGALMKQGASVTILEGFPWLLPRQLTRQAGNLLKQHLESTGIKVMCDVQVKEISGDEAVSSVLLNSGEEIPARLVILATGVRPNSYLARQCDLKVKRGVIVDDLMMTSDPRVFAAGDVTEHNGNLYGIWPASYAQGMIAGANAAGSMVEFTGIPPSTRLKVLEVDVFSIGHIQMDDASYQIYEKQNGTSYTSMVFRDGQLVGANLYGDTTLASVFKETIEKGRHILEMDDLLEAHPDIRKFCI